MKVVIDLTRTLTKDELAQVLRRLADGIADMSKLYPDYVMQSGDGKATIEF